MENILIKSQIALNQSNAPLDFFASQIAGFNEQRKTQRWGWLQSEWSPFKDLASKRSWRDKYKQANSLGKAQLVSWLAEQILECTDRNIYAKFEDSFCKTALNSDSCDVSASWITFLGFIDGFNKTAKDTPASFILEFCTSQAKRKMDMVETAVWMLIAYQEFTLVEAGHDIGAGNRSETPALTIDINNWIPEISGDGLTTTRYNVVNSILHSLNGGQLCDSDKRAIRRQRGDDPLLSHSNMPSTLNVDALYRSLDINSLGLSNHSYLEKQNFKSHFYGLMRFAGYFGLIQHHLLQKGLSSKLIVDRFSTCSEIKRSFYADLESYG